MTTGGWTPSQRLRPVSKKFRNGQPSERPLLCHNMLWFFTSPRFDRESKQAYDGDATHCDQQRAASHHQTERSGSMAESQLILKPVGPPPDINISRLSKLSGLSRATVRRRLADGWKPED